MSGASGKILITSDAVGGVWQYSTDLAEGLVGRGFEIVLAVLGPAPSSSQKRRLTDQPGITLIETNLALDWTAETAAEIETAAAEIFALARAHKVDLIHLHSAALAAFSKADVPVVVVQHSCVATWWSAVRGTALPANFVWRAELVSRGLQSADAVVAPSAAFARMTAETYQLRALPHVIPNARPRAERPSSSAAKEPFAFSAGRLWDEGKNIAILNEAAPRCNVAILAAGALRSPTGETKSFPRLQCLGPLSETEVATFLARQPIYVSPALYEPFGLAVLEAAQMGCALVLSDIPTFRELWGEAALFVPPHESEAFAKAINELAADPTRRAALGEAAKSHAMRYVQETMIDEVCVLYRECLPALSPRLDEQAA